jgi:hypothetical protein
MIDYILINANLDKILLHVNSVIQSRLGPVKSEVLTILLREYRGTGHE